MSAVGSRANTGSDMQKPRYSDIDASGLTHLGDVRKDNKDHYFLGSLSRALLRP